MAIVKLHGNDDPRHGALVIAVKNLIYERAVGNITLAAALGCLEVAKFEIWAEMLEQK